MNELKVERTKYHWLNEYVRDIKGGMIHIALQEEVPYKPCKIIIVNQN